MVNREIMLINKIENEIKEKAINFFNYTKVVSKTLRYIDELDPFKFDLSELEYILLKDDTALDIHKEIAWPDNIEEWRQESLSIDKDKILNKFKLSAITYNVIYAYKEITPPFYLIEISLVKKYNKKPYIKENIFKLIGGEEIIKNFTNNDEKIVPIIFDFINEIIKSYFSETYFDEPLFLLTDFPLSCIQTLDSNNYITNEYITTSQQNFINETKSLNIIPVSIIKSDSNPLMNGIAKFFIGKGNYCSECINSNDYYKEYSLCKIISLIYDKIYLLSKLKENERSPLLRYTNRILHKNFLGENIAIFYLRLSRNDIVRIEIPYCYKEYINTIHYILLKEIDKEKKSFKILNLAKRNLFTLKKNKEEITKLIDHFLRKESIISLKKEIGLIKI